MTNKKILYVVIVILFLVVVGGGLFLFSGNKGGQKENGGNQQAASSLSPDAQTTVGEKMVDCGEAKDNSECYLSRVNECLPVSARITASDKEKTAEIIILGSENGKCHFQRKINNVLDLECYLPKEDLNVDIFYQILGIDKGLQDVVYSACTLLNPQSE